MKLNFCFLIVLLFNFDCTSENGVEQSINNEDSLTTNQIDSLASKPDNALYLDTLVISWNDDLINLTKSGLDFTSSIKEQANKYVEGQIDTLELFTYKESYITIYRAAGKELLVNADIRNSELDISKGVKIGLNRNELKTILNKNSNKDTLDVTDFEGNTEVQFILSNNTISRIIYKAYVE